MNAATTLSDHARRLMLGLVAVLLALAGVQARAVELDFCANSASDLYSAMNAANANPGGVTRIKVVSGTYNFTPAFYEAGPMSLIGGYDATCSTRTVDPHATVLTGPQTFFPFLITNDLWIESIEFRGYAGGIEIRGVEEYPITVTLLRNIFTASSPCSGSFCGNESGALTVSMPIEDPESAMTLNITENLIYANDTDCGVFVDATNSDGDAQTYNIYSTFINNTIARNSGTGVCIRSEAPAAIMNNILWGNVVNDLEVITSYIGPYLTNNILGRGSFPPADVPPTGELNVDPHFVAPGAGDFHLQTSSAAINSGYQPVPQGLPYLDIGGSPRVVGSVVDRGAYESSVNDAFILTVTNNNDSGPGSLRNAIDSVNGDPSQAHLINFAIGSGCGPHVITLQTALPALVNSVWIGGYSQTGSSRNDRDVGDNADICIIVNAANAGVPYAFKVADSAPNSTQLVVDGIAFGGFGFAAINLQGGKQHGVSGTHFGGSVSGVALDPNQIDVYIGAGVTNSIVGGDDPAARNLLLTALGSGVVIADGQPPAVGASHNQVIGNYIGIGVNGNDFIARGNAGSGVYVGGFANTIANNTIGFNGDGISLIGADTRNNTVQANRIGIDAGGGQAANDGRGIVINGGHDNTLLDNLIDNNTGAGVRVTAGRGNAIRGNGIFANGGLGIDLADSGVLPNDNDFAVQPFDYANRGQNYPVLTNAIGGHTKGRVSGTLTSTAGDYHIDVFVSPTCDASNHGQGANRIAGYKVTIPAGGSGGQNSVGIGHAFAGSGLHTGAAITATATDSNGNTSEFSACTSYFDDTIFADGYDP